LSRWFRDYLYIPLGGNKQGLTRTLTNLAIVFLLCGLWHGAAITFLAWGLYHGFLLMLERLAKKTFNIEPTGMVGFVTTTLLVLIGWVVFRSGDLGQAKYMLAKMAFVDRSGNSIFGWQYFLTPYIGTVAAIGLWFAWLPSDAWGVRARLRGTWAAAAAALGLILIASSIAELSANGFNPFIYFQF
jgi:alginate O-acetyltransferase complex protein AlgI